MSQSAETLWADFSVVLFRHTVFSGSFSERVPRDPWPVPLAIPEKGLKKMWIELEAATLAFLQCSCGLVGGVIADSVASVGFSPGSSGAP